MFIYLILLITVAKSILTLPVNVNNKANLTDFDNIQLFQSDGPCYTKSCNIERSRLDLLNENISPCENFYEFSCYMNQDQDHLAKLHHEAVMSIYDGSTQLLIMLLNFQKLLTVNPRKKLKKLVL
ncbi:unnamed protein product [Brachionus calyciflorus]|uniref:Uncharacterized protein n=1 Tax=Brachionus calyciflorus TaxID=104777 RepID=A0A813W0P9_9BILA|nr:unnamed protein product [Brachionus calyciflorus]